MRLPNDNEQYRREEAREHETCGLNSVLQEIR